MREFGGLPLEHGGGEMSDKRGFTPGPWKFVQQSVYLEKAKLFGTELPEHEGYSRENNGDWIVTADDKYGMGVRVASAAFRGKAKRGSAWNAPDPEGQATARLISAAPELLEALEELMLALKDVTLPTAVEGYVRAAIAKAVGAK